MINDNTILSSFNDRPTLLEWLKKVEEALKSDTATAFHVNNRGNATLTFSIDFADGTSLESEPIVLQQGESVRSATIRNGHLILMLTNGDELDAGDLGAVNGFSINESQHLIVTYQNGTSQDLGAIFSGNVNIDGNFTANSIVENMSGYSFVRETLDAAFTPIYVSAVKNGNKLTCVWFLSFTPTETSYEGAKMGDINIPLSVSDKLYQFTLSGIDNLLDVKVVSLYSGYAEKVDGNLILQKYAFSILPKLYIYNLVVGKTYLLRYEVTFLLSDNLAGN